MFLFVEYIVEQEAWDRRFGLCLKYNTVGTHMQKCLRSVKCLTQVQHPKRSIRISLVKSLVSNQLLHFDDFNRDI